MIYYNIDDIPIEPAGFTSTGRGKNKKEFVWIFSGYDIETTQLYEKDEKGKVKWCCSVPYHQQMSINGNDVFFRYYDDFFRLLKRISKELQLGGNKYTVIFIQNMAFEFAHFWREFQENKYGIRISSVFAKKERQPLKVVLNNNIIFIDSMSVTNMSLEQIGKNFCTTKKMVGDLDYKKVRNRKTKLTEKEKKYCQNDVRILAEYSEYYFNEFLNHKYQSQNYLPLTSTSTVRHDLFAEFRGDEFVKKYKYAIKFCYPFDFKNYDAMMGIFSGGYTHANAYYVDETINNVHSFDIKSSYPRVMLESYNAMGKFYSIKDFQNEEKFRHYLEKFCCWFRVKMRNVKPKTTHSIISISKCCDIGDYRLDNGRVRSAELLTIDCTELDFDIYEKFYDFEYEILFMFIAHRGTLPNYLRRTVAKYYQQKDELSKKIERCTDEEEKRYLKQMYIKIKNKLNGIYGCTVTKLPIDEVEFTNDGWRTVSKCDKDEIVIKDKMRNCLLPQWGIWITAHARKRLLDMIYLLSINGKNDNVYSDTDSCKIVNYENNRWLFDLENAKIISENRKFIKELELPEEVFHMIGCWEWETSGKEGGVYQKFKTLGSKRYIYLQRDGWHTTIAGLPKMSLVEYCEKCEKNIEDVFAAGMLVGAGDSNKLCSYYIDEQMTVDVDDGVTVESIIVKSGLCLIETTFSMSVLDTLLQLGFAMRKNEEFTGSLNFA